jgi:hypothetical protein
LSGQPNPPRVANSLAALRRSSGAGAECGQAWLRTLSIRAIALMINLDTAEVLGRDVPLTLLARAGEVIE